MQDKGIIKKVAPGIYIDVNSKKDNYYIFGLSMPNAIFSHMTALYFHGLSTKSPNCVYDITVKKSYNSTHLRKHNVFYVNNDIYELGLTEIETPMGNKIKEYYYATTFGSRVADGVYETQLDGYELKELSDRTGKKVYHVLFIDAYRTWWIQGKSYLCRIIDALNMGLVDEVIIGREVFTRWPELLQTIL